MIDEKKGKTAILRLKEARKAVVESRSEAGCWIVKEIDVSIKALQTEMELVGHDFICGRAGKIGVR